MMRPSKYSGTDCTSSQGKGLGMITGNPGKIELGRCSVTVYGKRETEIFIDNLLVRVHSIIEIILVDQPCATGV